MADEPAGETTTTVADGSPDEELELLGFDDGPAPNPESNPPQTPAGANPTAFGRVLQVEAKRAGLNESDLSKIPEAVVVEAIPEAVPVDQVPMAKQRREIIATRRRPRPTGSGNGEVRRIGRLPESRNVEDEIPIPVTEPAPEVNPKRFLTLDDAKEGNFRTAPLQRDPSLVRTTPAKIERSKFLDGELPRHIERGVTYPQPGRLLSASLFVLLAKVFAVANVIVLPWVAVTNRDGFMNLWWLMLGFVVFGIGFLSLANKTRCKVCTCHLFFKKNCFIHNKAHRVPFLGAAGSAALHLILFRWLRCMYCGTAIRLRKPTSEEVAQASQAHEKAVAESQRSAAKTAGEY
ncbi:MAG: hypothetical protein AAGA58_12040 [Verrucomicrobiota bacterium]